MSNPYGVPGISVQEVARRQAEDEAICLLDVREPHELLRANLGEDVLTAPLSQLAQKQLAALPDDIRENKDAEVIVFCHHGARSAQVVAWLRQQGWGNVINMDGGIDAYAQEIDPEVGRY